ncbi:MAG TPA: hypothetical protein DE315_01840 [Candidatus Omnitrophica bacterium]|nr:MAG: hypothetical protein A2Y05_04715 [Omnitrophica WOR_2 bacterium GWA2_53_43]HBO97185.1 hypothetical protein [Candidatus Omnitrophota bacterium]HCI44261.1 hypothetical protein [Candidatus Omnitrophota bacterium]
MREQLSLTISRLAISFFVFQGCAGLFFIKPAAADGGKEIKAHPNAQKESLPGTEDLKAKAEGYNNQAIDLFEAGRYSEAQDLWEKAIHLMEHPREARPDLDVVTEEQQSLESPRVLPPDESLEASPIAVQYQSGLSLLEQKEYGEAQKVFQEIDLIQPGYRNTKRYLIVIGELLREGDLPATQGSTGDEPESQTAADHEEYPAMAQESPGADAGPGFDHREEEAQWEEAVEEAEQKLLEQIAEKAGPIYQRALQQYKNKEYVEARRSFEEVQVLSPDYKLTARYLDGIDDDILYARQQQEEAQRLAEERARRRDEQEFRKTIAAREEIYRKELAGKAEEIYQQAIADFKGRKFEEAEDNFRKVDVMAAGYKLTGKYLERIQQLRDDEARLQAEEESRRQALMEHKAEEDMYRTVEEAERLRQQELRERLEAAYQGARAYYGQGELEKARAGFNEVERISPDYHSARKYLALIEKDMAREQELETEMASDLESAAPSWEEVKKVVVPASRARLEAEQYYRQAKELYKKRQFDKAKEFFQKVDALVKDYQATGKFLARIDMDIEREEKYQQTLAQRDEQRQARGKVLEQKRAAAKEALARRRQETRGLRETAARIKGERNKMIGRKVIELYREAESDYKNRLYALAKERFSEVQRISPGYKSAGEYLERIAYEHRTKAAIEVVPPPGDAPAYVEERILTAPAQKEVVSVREIVPIPVAQEKFAEPAATAPDDDVAFAYDEAVSLLKRKDYVQARKKFEHVDRLYPGYKSTSGYLTRIDSLLQREQQRQLQEQQQALARAVRREKAARGRARPMAVEPAAVEMPEPGPANVAAASTEVSAKEEPAKTDDPLSAKAQELFQEAVKLYASGQFVPAREKFLELELVRPGYKTTSKYLEWIERALVRETKKTELTKQKQEQEVARVIAKEKTAQELAEKNRLKMQRTEEKKRQRLLKEVERKYGQAVIAYAKKDFAGAKQKFIGVEALYPGFKETTRYLSRVDADIAARNKKSREVVAAPVYVRPQRDIAREQDRLKTKELFDQGVRLYGSNQLVPAREKFQEVERTAPDYKTTRKYMVWIDRALLKEQKKADRIKQKQDKESADRVAMENAIKQKQEARNARLETKAQKDREQLQKDRQEAENARIKQQKKEREAKQRQEDVRTARRETDAQKARDKAEKAHQREEAERRKERPQVQAKPLPLNVPEPKFSLVNPPDFDALDLDQDAAALRRQYAQIQKERRNLQAAIQSRIGQTYARAVQLYELGHYAGAKNLFNEIAAVQPSFKGTKNFLVEIDQKLAMSPAAVATPQNAVAAPSVYVKPRVQVVSDALDSLEVPQQ